MNRHVTGIVLATLMVVTAGCRLRNRVVLEQLPPPAFEAAPRPNTLPVTDDEPQPASDLWSVPPLPPGPSSQPIE